MAVKKEEKQEEVQKNQYKILAFSLGAVSQPVGNEGAILSPATIEAHLQSWYNQGYEVVGKPTNVFVPEREGVPEYIRQIYFLRLRD